MADDRSNAVARIEAALKTNVPEPAKASLERVVNKRRFGYRFVRGDAIVDVGSGQRGRVESSRPGIAGSESMYEILFTSGERGARLDRELELDPAPPTTRPG